MPLVPAKSSDEANVRPDSAFAAELRDLIHMARPRRIIETGTLHATGTTLIIGDALKAHSIEADFRTIECNPQHAEEARRNIERLGLPVKLVEGLSVEWNRMPSIEAVRQWLADLDAQPEAIRVDFGGSSDPAFVYGLEVSHIEKPGNRIGAILDEWSGCCDLAVLDSAGHLGMTEILTLCDHLRTRCYIALDDTRHVKHWDTMNYVRQRPDHFRVVVEGDERFGFAILHYTS